MDRSYLKLALGRALRDASALPRLFESFIFMFQANSRFTMRYCSIVAGYSDNYGSLTQFAPVRILQTARQKLQITGRIYSAALASAEQRKA